MKKIILTLVTFCLAFPFLNYGQAGHKNSVSVEAMSFFIPRGFNFGLDPSQFTRQCGIRAQRNFGKHFGVLAGYSWWNSFMNSDALLNKELMVDQPQRLSQPGALKYRSQYKMADILGVYSKTIGKRHEVTAGLGGTYAWGQDTYEANLPIPPLVIGTFYAYCGTGFSDVVREGRHFGALASISYDYYLLKGRLSIGVAARSRKYLDLSSCQVEYGFHAGVHF